MAEVPASPAPTHNSSHNGAAPPQPSPAVSSFHSPVSNRSRRSAPQQQQSGIQSPLLSPRSSNASHRRTFNFNSPAASRRSNRPLTPGGLGEELLMEEEEDQGRLGSGGGGGGGGGNGGDDDDDQYDQDPNDYDPLDDAMIWGTTYRVKTFRLRFTHFIRNFRLPARQGDDANDANVEPELPHYLGLLAQVHDTQDYSININCRHMWNHLPVRRCYHILLRYPQDIIALMDKVINQEYARIYGEEDINHKRIQVRIFNLRQLRRMRDLDPENIDQLVALRGMVIRCSTILPDLIVAFFRCSVCAKEVEAEVDRGMVDEPKVCPNCQERETMELIFNRSQYCNKQIIRMQETPEEIPEGETPNSVVLFAYDDLSDAVRPGDRIEVTGILRTVGRRLHPRMRTVRSVYKTYVEALHFSQINQDLRVEAGPGEGTLRAAVGTTGQDTDRQRGLHLPPERVEEIRALSTDPDVYEKLAQAVAPSIWELDDVKKGTLCLLFGGTDKKSSRIRRPRRRRRLEDGSAGPADDDDVDADPEDEEGDTDGQHKAGFVDCRGDINILLCGDPGTSKSQLLLYVHKLAPRGIYTSGKGSSAVGLTASVIRDAETKELVLESGALVLSDQGVCCIDEFDKMSDTTRAVLHEAMEQQTVSIAKAGIICTLNARTSILASANPVESRYNPRLSVVENIKLPPTLLSRFDLIYLVLDQPNEDRDRRLAHHLVSLYYDQPEAALPDVDHDLLRDYIAYARANVHPVLSEEAGEQLVAEYLKLRGYGGEGKTITATPRQLESLIRLSEALAKIRLAEVVERHDVLEAQRLMTVATLKAATDPETGRLDLGNLDGSSKDRESRQQLAGAVKDFLSSRKGQRLTVSEIRHEMQSSSDMDIRQGMLVEVLRTQLEPEGVIKYLHATHTVMVK